MNATMQATVNEFVTMAQAQMDGATWDAETQAHFEQVKSAVETFGRETRSAQAQTPVTQNAPRREWTATDMMFYNVGRKVRASMRQSRVAWAKRERDAFSVEDHDYTPGMSVTDVWTGEAYTFVGVVWSYTMRRRVMVVRYAEGVMAFVPMEEVTTAPQSAD